jgi:hypothetical protein
MGKSLERYSARPNRQTSRALERLDHGQSLARANDQAQAGLAAGRISDIARVTRHGLGAASHIAAEAQMAAEVAPWAADDIARIARTGFGAIQSEIANLTDPWS